MITMLFVLPYRRQTIITDHTYRHHPRHPVVSKINLNQAFEPPIDHILAVMRIEYL